MIQMEKKSAISFLAEIALNEKKVKEALKEIEKNCVFLKILGSYPIEGGKNAG